MMIFSWPWEVRAFTRLAGLGVLESLLPDLPRVGVAFQGFQKFTADLDGVQSKRAQSVRRLEDDTASSGQEDPPPIFWKRVWGLHPYDGVFRHAVQRGQSGPAIGANIQSRPSVSFIEQRHGAEAHGGGEESTRWVGPAGLHSARFPGHGRLPARENGLLVLADRGAARAGRRTGSVEGGRE